MSVGAIAVDGAAISRSLSALRAGRVNYRELAHKVSKIIGVDLKYRTYYASHRDPESAERRQGFYEHLRSSGWAVFDYLAKLCPDGIWRDKGIDLAIALDAYKLALEGRISALVVATHDEDFAELFRRVAAAKVKGYVLGWKERMASALPVVAEPIWMDDLNGVLRRNTGDVRKTASSGIRAGN